MTESNVLCGSQAELQRSLQAKESSAAAAQEALSEKEMELRELKSQKAAEKGLISKEDHEALRLSLQAEINAVTARFNDLTRKHEKTCTEVRVHVCGSASWCLPTQTFLIPPKSLLGVIVFATKWTVVRDGPLSCLCIIHNCITFSIVPPCFHYPPLLQVLNEAPLIVHFRSSRRRLSSTKMRINICKHVSDTLKLSIKFERTQNIVWDSQ